MGYSNWLVVAGLALVPAFAPGCKTKCEEVAPNQPADGELRSKTKALMSASPGVVEIYRYGEIGPVGYVCLDDAAPGCSWWLLRDGMTPPVMPASIDPMDNVIWHKISDEHMTGEQLCARYGTFLDGEKLWHVCGTESNCPTIKK